MKRYLLFVAVPFLVSCGPRVPTPEEAADDVRAMRFVQHPNGLCFGVVTYATYANYRGSSVTLVPTEYCAKK